ncbi:hypothetical protein [Agrobacterium tumefaciens]|uniref:hypothetical protein n=1 Tax=Agrobacterium tumefaciens TaxID=358 RepID=UPI00287DC9C3|nr:hypothetical protein [Agrobacterium tumefaciens]MDS7594940.1 hypothetical protein [Agrobacterium tumefaciens]
MENLPSVINRRNLLPLAARILPVLLEELPSRTIAGPTHAKELWPRWWDLHQQQLAAERKCRDLEAKLLEETGGRPSVTINFDGDPSFSRVIDTFDEIRAVAPCIGAEAAAKVRAQLRQRRRQWNAMDKRVGYSAARAEAQDISRFAGIAGRVLISLQPYYIHDLAAKLHCMLVMYDPELKRQEMPWPYLRKMLRQLIQPQWSIIEPQSRIRWLRPIARKEDLPSDADMIAAGRELSVAGEPLAREAHAA